jgi:hypothetical protein
MPSSYRKFPDEPIVVVTLPADYNLAAELPVVMPKYMQELGSFTEPVFWIVDARQAPFSVDDIITGADLVAKGQHPLYKHPNIRQVIYVASSQLLKLAVAGMGSEAFGKIAIKLFDDLEVALKFARDNR